jgi:hypothetical protein
MTAVGPPAAWLTMSVAASLVTVPPAPLTVTRKGARGRRCGVNRRCTTAASRRDLDAVAEPLVSQRLAAAATAKVADSPTSTVASAGCVTICGRRRADAGRAERERRRVTQNACPAG